MTTSAKPFCAAIMSGVNSLVPAIIPANAPAPSSTFTTAGQFIDAAREMAVCPSHVTLEMFAPAAKSPSTIFSRQAIAPYMRAVAPVDDLRLTSAPLFTR